MLLVVKILAVTLEDPAEQHEEAIPMSPTSVTCHAIVKRGEGHIVTSLFKSVVRYSMLNRAGISSLVCRLITERVAFIANPQPAGEVRR